jgi:hypothetical protein
MFLHIIIDILDMRYALILDNMLQYIEKRLDNRREVGYKGSVRAEVNHP